MSTPAQMRIESYFNDGEETIHQTQDMYTYSDGYSWNYIPDSIMCYVKWFLGVVHAYENDAIGSHWFINFFLSNWKSEDKENELESLEEIQNNFRQCCMIHYYYELHFFIRIWIQYGSNVGWVPFSQENLGGKAEWGYYNKDDDPYFTIKVFSMHSPDNPYGVLGHEICIPDKEPHEENIIETFEEFERATGMKLEIQKRDGSLVVFIPFIETLVQMTYINQNLLREKLLAVKNLNTRNRSN